MFDFFKDPKWRLWSWGGGALALSLIFLGVYLDLQINRWYRDFYDQIQVFLSYGNIHDDSGMAVYFGMMAVFFFIAMNAVIVDVFEMFFTSHWLFRWRTNMVDWCHGVYEHARHIEGASQRVQEDTIKFTRIMESLASRFVRSVLTLIMFFSELMAISWFIPVMFFGDWDYGLVAGAVLWTIGGMVFMAGLSWLLGLVGVEYNIQKEEASYRKILVRAEDDGTIEPKSFSEIFDDVRRIHYQNYFRYLWFNLGRYTFYQANVLTAYIFLAPAIVGGYLTLGLMSQIVNAFNKVESSMQYLIHSWPMIIEGASVYKRLREFRSKVLPIVAEIEKAKEEDK